MTCASLELPKVEQNSTHGSRTAAGISPHCALLDVGWDGSGAVTTAWCAGAMSVDELRSQSG